MQKKMPYKIQKQYNVGLFVTCLVDLMRPSIGFAAIKLLEEAGCIVSVPRLQTCCGQPAYNSGDKVYTAAIAKQVVDAFSEFDYVVTPSGSCAGMIKLHYQAVFGNDETLALKANKLAKKTFELTTFLVEVMSQEKYSSLGIMDVLATYHDSCSGLRELGIKHQPRQLLQNIEGHFSKI